MSDPLTTDLEPVTDSIDLSAPSAALWTLRAIYEWYSIACAGIVLFALVMLEVYSLEKQPVAEVIVCAVGWVLLPLLITMLLRGQLLGGSLRSYFFLLGGLIVTWFILDAVFGTLPFAMIATLPLELATLIALIIGVFPCVRLQRARRDPTVAAAISRYRKEQCYGLIRSVRRALEAHRIDLRVSVAAALALFVMLLAFPTAVILGVAFLDHVKLQTLPYTDTTPYVVPTFIPALVLFAIAIWLARRARSLAQLSAIEAQRRSSKPPLLFLRSFQDDERFRVGTYIFGSVLSAKLGGVALEEVLVSVLQEDGPVIAIGRPGERGRPIGAARSYHSDDEWQAVIEERIEFAQCIVALVGPTENIAWEFTRVRHLEATRKLLLIFPITRWDALVDRWARFATAFPDFNKAFRALIVREIDLTEQDPRRKRVQPLVCALHRGYPQFFSSSTQSDIAYRLALCAARVHSDIEE